MPKLPTSDFDEIYRLYAKYVYRYLAGLSFSEQLAEELTAETFYHAVKNINSYRSEYSMPVWLKSIAKNLYIDYLRKKERQNVSIDGEDFPDGADAVLILEDREQALNVHKALHTLDEPYKEVFSLRVFGELSYKEIGGLFGKSDGWARTVFFRAKEKIINKLNEQE
ncbi:MAG: sigma-70 family RNA polymerase sigma factor [Oscillospiraceae bacterium]|nr:sigma-70 family RNA polymerase sigma factor [Oscillospiraceae bacterium]